MFTVLVYNRNLRERQIDICRDCIVGRVEIFIVLVYNMISLLSIVPMTRESEYL